MQVRYVGITQFSVEFRRRSHISKAKQGESGHRPCWIRHLLSLGLEPVAVLLEETESRDRERYWIADYRRLGADLTNGTDGGDGAAGYRHSEITRQKLREAWKSREPVSPEAQRRAADSRCGRKLSEETKAKIGAAHRGKRETSEAIQSRIGRPVSPATRQKISDTKKGKRKELDV